MMTVLVPVEVRPALSVATWLLRGGDDLRVTTRRLPRGHLSSRHKGHFRDGLAGQSHIGTGGWQQWVIPPDASAWRPLTVRHSFL
jgi:hypothetical protein